MKCKAHIVNLKITMAFFLMVQLTSCQTVNRKTSTEGLPSVQAIESALDEGRYYQARKMTQELLSDEPENAELKNLMAKVLEREIAEQKQAFDQSAIEEYDTEDNQREVLTWLERAKGFHHEGEYEQALLSAEEVFKYDPTNAEASRLIDEIRKQVYAEGKQDAVFLKRMYQDEISERVKRYKEEGKDRIAQGKPAQAKLVLQKALLLDPTDKEVSQLYKQLQNENEGISA